MAVIDQIIAPDGDSLELSGDFSSPILSGLGMPPLQTVRRRIPMTHYSVTEGISAGLRTLYIVTHARGTNFATLANKVAELNDILRPNRMTARGQHWIYRLTNEAGKSADLYCHPEAVIEREHIAFTQQIGVQFVADDPFWHQTSAETAALDFADTVAARYIIARVNGVWTALGVTSGGDSVVALEQDDSYLYVAGSGTAAWNGVADATYMARYNKGTGVWSAMSSALSAAPKALAKAPNGNIWVGGGNLDGGGHYILEWDAGAESWGTSTTGSPPASGVYGLAFDVDGTLYAVGTDFCKQRTAAGTWSDVGAIGSFYALCVTVGHDGTIYVGGTNATTSKAELMTWDGSSWSTAGTCTGISGEVRAVVAGVDGLIYAFGLFDNMGGIDTVDRIAFDGYAFLGVDAADAAGRVYSAYASPDGTVYIGMSNAVPERWNGFTWANVPIDTAGFTALTFLADGNDLYIGLNTTGNITVAGDTVVTNSGGAPAEPIITITGPGVLASVRNETLGLEMLFDLTVNAGESITIDQRHDVKAVESTWRRRIETLPGGDDDLYLAPGENVITVLMTGTDGDSNAELQFMQSDWSYEEAVS